MRSRSLRAVTGISRIGLCAAVFWTTPVTTLAQSVPFMPRVLASESRPFSQFDDSLTATADSLLVSPVPIAVAVAAKASVDETAEVDPDLRIDQQRRTMLDSGLTVAAARLDLLRPVVEPILRSRGVPTELAAVIAVESGGRSMALSPKGARGLWQLMPDTARRYGLRVDDVHDDRVDLFKATDAAARYLRDLHAQFGDWKLALAAYNTGEGHVGSAILRAHTQDFDQLLNLRMLPLETRDYVPRVLATVRLIGPSSSLERGHSQPGAITIFASSTP